MRVFRRPTRTRGLRSRGRHARPTQAELRARRRTELAEQRLLNTERAIHHEIERIRVLI
jgi:hypothetical protein